MTQGILMTEEGFIELKKELEELKTVKRKEIAEKIKTARGFGDLSENSEYDEAKNEQAIVEARIQLLEEQLKAVEIVSKEKLSNDIVQVGCMVKILDLDFEEEMEYRIVSAVESHSSMNTITIDSPVGQALKDKRVGDVVEVKAPGGIVKMKVLSIGI